MKISDAPTIGEIIAITQRSHTRILCPKMNAEQLIEHIANNKLSDLEVNYPNGLVVEKGKMLPMIGTQREPEVKFPFDSHYHTLLMIDTDAPR